MAASLLGPGLVAAAVLGIVQLFRIGSREPGLPPGPKTVPLLGNLASIPTEFAWYKFTEWARVYGPIYSLKMGPGTAIVISGPAALKELMDKRSASTVDRPQNHMADVVGDGVHMLVAHYTETWRILRRAAHSILTPQATEAHLPIQKAEAAQLLYDLLKEPKGFYTHFRRYSNSAIMSVLYGKRCPRYETQDALALFEAQHLWEKVLEPGAHPPIDAVPILKYVPAMFSSWKRLCAETRRLQSNLYFRLMDEVAERVGRGQENGCYMEGVMKRQAELGLTREMSGYLGGVLLEGGSDTTASFLQALVLLLTAHPEVQKKAQEEVDRVVGVDRMPQLEDFQHMPYINALIRETHRFRPITPIAIPHASVKDEEYQGYIIPKGATILVNLWGIYQDPNLFDKPEIFNPDRYLLTEHGTKPGVNDDGMRASLPFGSGRRICPGMHLANTSLKLNTMNLLWAFNFTPPSSEPINISDMTRGVVTAPKPFETTITVRDNHKKGVIEREFVAAIDTFMLFEDSLAQVDKDWVAQNRVGT